MNDQFTIAEVARRLSISTSAVRVRIATRNIPTSVRVPVAGEPKRRGAPAKLVSMSAVADAAAPLAK